MDTPQSLGEVAWRTWSTARGHDRTWDQVSPEIQNDWERVAAAVIAASTEGLAVQIKQIAIVDDPTVIRGTGGTQ